MGKIMWISVRGVTGKLLEIEANYEDRHRDVFHSVTRKITSYSVWLWNDSTESEIHFLLVDESEIEIKHNCSCAVAEGVDV